MPRAEKDLREAAYGQAYIDYLAGRGSLRQWVRSFYLDRVTRMVTGPAVDLGCGAGVLLQRLPAGSFGLEVNEVAVAHCRAKGLDARHFDPAAPVDAVLEREVTGAQTSLCCLHVLEHLIDPGDYAVRILRAGPGLGLGTLVFVVPGHRGFASDPTHRTFIDRAFFAALVSRHPGWQITNSSYFPFASEGVSRHFTHNELQTRLVYSQPRPSKRTHP